MTVRLKPLNASNRFIRNTLFTPILRFNKQLKPIILGDNLILTTNSYILLTNGNRLALSKP